MSLASSLSIALGTGLTIGLVYPERVHQSAGGWTYPPACCRGTDIGGDCEQIPTGDVYKGRYGYSIMLHPGDHRLVTRVHEFFVPYGKEITSGDGAYHVCLHPTEDNVVCFFAPPDGV
ncbi:hypothetical protein MRS76_17340 [Rhizobiaceae bacterium n13]|uniref:Uncharacterized protein n=1 Tax=Ferirhizobium litorale TaxID=2927786 RepID=A0AAE3QHQ7_9HYPH|nr:hypothetical protein [Fererhizobium litorale]MDI7863720.1 hypothetical protein [Fererhizobium litorale]MDI7924180.1 hypothetical protein [Fererhizobium litorale]